MGLATALNAAADFENLSVPVTKAMLMEKKSFELAIPDVPGIGAQPTKFRAEYDAAKAGYRFTFSGFMSASPAS